jgi:hypothetical protein
MADRRGSMTRSPTARMARMGAIPSGAIIAMLGMSKAAPERRCASDTLPIKEGSARLASGL